MKKKEESTFFCMDKLGKSLTDERSSVDGQTRVLVQVAQPLVL